MASQSSNFDITKLYEFWDTYFDDPLKQEYDPQDSNHQMIAILHEIFSRNPDIYQIANYNTYIECVLDIEALFTQIDEKKELMDVFINNPKPWINSIGVSISSLKKKKAIVRLHNILRVEVLKSQDIGKYIAITGTIISTSAPKLVITKACFLCGGCDKQFKTAAVSEASIQPPKNCPDCKSTQIKLDRNSCDVVLHQRIKVSDQKQITIDIEIRDNLVGTFISGDNIIVNGILSTFQDEQKSSLYTKYIQAYHIQLYEEQSSQEKFSKQETNQLNEMKTCEQLFPALVQNFCPTIFGHEIVKAGLLLCLAGGSNGSRQNSHCLLVGDPGQGKSQLLKFVQLISPHSIFISGTSVSTCGLTCSVSKKEDDTIIDAGALIMADQGVCCLDEFDKMSNQHSALLEAMEQQTITVAKSAVMCQFHARTTIIATANPQCGKFQKNKSLAENIKIQNTILSRFDLIYLLIDQPDPLRDQKLSEHIMSLHNLKKPRQSLESDNWSPSPIGYRCLNDRLKLECQTEYTISPIFMKKILYHISSLQPLMTNGAIKLVTDYYVKIRQSSVLTSTPITTRQLESLIRLSQAKAKLSLKQEVTQSDAQFAIDVFEETRFDCFGMPGQQPTAKLDKQKIGNLSKPKQTQLFLDALHSVASSKNTFEFTIEEIKTIARQINLSVGDLGDFIEKLNNESLLIKRGSQEYELNYKR